jgi:hypothetical protein
MNSQKTVNGKPAQPGTQLTKGKAPLTESRPVSVSELAINLNSQDPQVRKRAASELATKAAKQL